MCICIKVICFIMVTATIIVWDTIPYYKLLNTFGVLGGFVYGTV